MKEKLLNVSMGGFRSANMGKNKEVIEISPFCPERTKGIPNKRVKI
jgi:hypothetical protein